MSPVEPNKITDGKPLDGTLYRGQNLLQGFGFWNYHLYIIVIQLSQQRPLRIGNYLSKKDAYVNTELPKPDPTDFHWLKLKSLLEE